MKTPEMMQPPLVAPPGLKGLVVADTEVGSVRGDHGFFHYREFDATAIATTHTFEAVMHLLLEGRLPSASEEAALRAEIGRARSLTDPVLGLAEQLARFGSTPMAALRALLSIVIDSRPTLDLGDEERREVVVAAIGATPTILASVHRLRAGHAPVAPDASLPHVADYVRMVAGAVPGGAQVRAVERYFSLTADHGFNASTFAGRVIASTGADIGGCLAGAVGALSGPLHGGAPSRVLDMLEAIGDPANTESWAQSELRAGRKIMGFGHAVYRSSDPRSDILKQAALDLGGALVDRAVEIESRILPVLEEWKPESRIVTNVEFYAAVLLHLAGIPQEMFAPTFASSRVVGWSAHLLEQASVGRIMRPAARYVGVEPTMGRATSLSPQSLE